jgi:hypothetical protein
VSATAATLAGILRGAGLTVNLDYLGAGETDGQFKPLGLILHHDAAGLSYTDGWGGDDVVAVPRNMAQPGGNGAQFWVGRSGTWYILSAGRKWHAGIGDGYGHIPANSGNIYAYGIETDYGPVRQQWSGPTVTSDGYTWPVWDAAHRTAIDAGSRALAKTLGLNTFCGHKEYAPTRKIDPANLSLNDWRAYIGASTPSTPSEPAAPPAATASSDLLEWIMSLPGAPANLTYAQLVKDVAVAAANQVALAATNYNATSEGVKKTTERGFEVSANKVNHGQNYDGTKPKK